MQFHMTITKAKIMIGGLSILSVASLVGGVSGTVAWFQYSTRVTAGFRGQIGKCTENLRVRIHDENVEGYDDESAWLSDIKVRDLATYLDLAGIGTGLKPITALRTDENGDLTGIDKQSPIESFKSNPVRTKFGYDSWIDAFPEDYVFIPLQFKLIDVAGEGVEAVFADREIYLADLTLGEKHSFGKKDVSNALRVSVDGFNDEEGSEHVTLNWSKQGGSIDSHGYLDLDGDGVDDENDGYEWDGIGARVYGNGTQSTYQADYAGNNGSRNSAETPLADDSGTGHLEKDNAIPLGKTDENGLLNVNVTVWLEGWQPLATNETTQEGDAIESKIWNDNDYIGSEFNVGMRFVVDIL